MHANPCFSIRRYACEGAGTWANSGNENALCDKEKRKRVQGKGSLLSVVDIVLRRLPYPWKQYLGARLRACLECAREPAAMRSALDCVLQTSCTVNKTGKLVKESRLDKPWVNKAWE